VDVALAEKYEKPVEEAVWIPGADLAHAWRAFVSEAKAVKIAEPPGLGGGQPFVVHAPDKDIAVKLKLPPEAKKVTLYDGARKLEEKSGVASEFTIRLALGVQHIAAWQAHFIRHLPHSQPAVSSLRPMRRGDRRKG